MSIRPTDDEWMSLEEFAKIVGKKISTLYNERSRGTDFPPTYNLSKKQVRLRRSDVDAWLEKHRHIPSSVELKQLESGVGTSHASAQPGRASRPIPRPGTGA